MWAWRLNMGVAANATWMHAYFCKCRYDICVFAHQTAFCQTEGYPSYAPAVGAASHINGYADLASLLRLL